MPHLAPLSWPAAFISFWLIFILLNSMVWWLQLPKFPPIKFPSLPPNQRPWMWK